MSTVLEILSYIREWGFVGILILVIASLIKTLMDEDLSARLRARIYKVLYLLTRKKEVEKRYVANDINSRINLARRKLHFGSEILPRAVKVEWISDNGGQTYDLKEGEFVVRLDPAKLQEANIVRLATAVVQRTSCLGVRHLMEREIIDAVDLNLVRNILREVGDRKILDWFFSNEYKPRVAQNPKMSEWSKCIVEIDERGLFTKIFLVELDAFAKRIHGMPPRPYMVGSIEGLVRFLYRISTKQLGQDVPLDYLRAYIKIGVLLVAQTSKLLEQGIEPYVKAMNIRLEKEFDSVYIIILDKEMLGKADPDLRDRFIELTASLEKVILQSSLITKDFEVTYACTDSLGRRRKAKCIRYMIASKP